FLGDAGDFGREGVELIDHGVDGVLQLENFAVDIDGDLARQIAAGDGGGDLGDVADLRREVGRHRADVVGVPLPDAAHAFCLGLAAELAVGADLAGHARYFRREGVELIDHGIERVLELEDLAADVNGDLLGQVAAGDGRGDFGNVADLVRQVRRH